MARDVWQNIRPVVPTKLINKKFTVPVFDVECGELHTCVRFFSDGTNQGYADEILLTAVDLTAAVTIEGWVKLDALPAEASTDNFGCLFQRHGVDVYIAIGVHANGSMLWEMLKTAAHVNITTAANTVPVGEWFHYACSWDGTTMMLYINGVLKGSTALAAPVDAGAPTRHFIGLGTQTAGSENWKHFKGYIDEVRIWNVGRSQNEIVASYLAPRNKVAGDGVDDNLKFYYKFQEGSGSTTSESINGGFATLLISVNQYTWITDDGFPYRYGSSFICSEAEVVVGTPCSLKFPIDKPDDPNHGLFVRYQDTEGEWQRRRLYESGESYDPVNINPFLCPGVYNGERLSETFYIETWNVDGQERATLEEAIDINISITSNPTSGRDHTQLVAATPTVNTELAFDINPVVNPMVPDQTQVYT